MVLFFLALLDQLYWILGSCIGAVAGSLIPFDSTGIDFAMTALFLVIFVEQWEAHKNKIPALCGILISFGFLLVFGPDHFLIFSMAGILAALLLFRKQCTKPEPTISDAGSSADTKPAPKEDFTA